MPMQTRKRKALEAAGWKVGDAADFLEMSDDERRVLDARMELALAIRRLRKARGLTQKWLAAALKTSQPRIVKIERADPDVSFDQLLRGFAALGGRFEMKLSSPKPAKKRSRSKVSAASCGPV